METYNPDEAVPLVGMAANTIRGWCKTYASELSPGANPTKGEERRLTQEDIAKLQRVKRWRDERRPAQEIMRLLQAAASAQEQAHLVIEAAPATAIETIQPAQLTRLEGRIEAVEDINGMIREQLAALREEQKERTNYGITMLVIGASIMLVAVALATLLN